MLLNHAGIAGLIPPDGAMCLVDGVVSWDASRIRCTSRSHRDQDNPLRADGRLPALCAIEYAAQAMAVHGGLAGSISAPPRAGFLASVRGVIINRDRFDDLEDELIVDAEKILGDEGRVIYQFAVHAGGLPIVSGRAAVVLDTAFIHSSGTPA